jgi:hypothetical protein
MRFREGLGGHTFRAQAGLGFSLLPSALIAKLYTRVYHFTAAVLSPQMNVV